MAGSTTGGGNAPILTLSSKLPDRDVVSIDGVDYELARYHDLSLHKHGKFERKYLAALNLYGELLGKDADTLSEEDLDFLEQRTGEAMTDAAAMVVRKCPKAEIDKLQIEDRMEICAAFQRAVRLWRAGRRTPRATPEATETTTGDASSTPSPPASDKDPATGSAPPASANS